MALPPPVLSVFAKTPSSNSSSSASSSVASSVAEATLIQSVWRGFTDRRMMSDLMEDLGYFDEGGTFNLSSFHYAWTKMKAA